nr:hypothetical protein B0A51_00007 [Rachicladosporium sp. CCFEE 5018]
MASTAGQPLTIAAVQSLPSAASDASGSPDAPAQDADKQADEQTNADEDEGEDSDDDDDDDRSSWYDSNGNELTQSEKDERDFQDQSAIWHRDDNSQICHKHESSFTDDTMFDMESPHDLRQMYDHCTAQQLQRFVRDRGLDDPFPGRLTLKYHYISILVAADKERSFRLMDLPPEIRVLIYGEMLTLKECSCGCPKLACDTQILCASREVYAEANDILYARNKISCKFMVHTHDGANEPHVCAKVHDKSWPRDTCPLMYIHRDSPELPEDIPSFFLHVHNMEITIDCHGEGDLDDAFGMVKKCLLNLSTVLMENQNLKRLTVHVVNHLTKDKHKSLKMLWPLKRLRRLQHFDLTGDVSDESVDEISSSVLAAEPAWPRRNTLLQCGVLLQEADAFLLLAARVEQTRCRCEGYCQASFCGDDSTCDRPLQSRIGDAREEILDSSDYEMDPFVEGPFASEGCEERLTAKLDKLRRLLYKVQLEKVEDSLKQLREAIETRQVPIPQSKRFVLAEAEPDHSTQQSPRPTPPGVYLHMKRDDIFKVAYGLMMGSSETQSYDAQLRVGDLAGIADTGCRTLPLLPPKFTLPEDCQDFKTIAEAPSPGEAHTPEDQSS